MNIRITIEISKNQQIKQNRKTKKRHVQVLNQLATMFNEGNNGPIDAGGIPIDESTPKVQEASKSHNPTASRIYMTVQ